MLDVYHQAAAVHPQRRRRSLTDRRRVPRGLAERTPYVVVAERLGRLLDAEDDLVVLDLAHDTDQAIRSAAVHQPAVLVLDAHLTTGGLAETLAAARAAAPATRLLVLSDDAGSRPGNRRSWWPTNRRRAMTRASSCGCGP